MAQGPITDVLGFTGLEYPVPLGAKSLTIQVTATDHAGNVTIDMLNVQVLEALFPLVDIITPAEAGKEFIEGDKIMLEATAESQSDGPISSAEFILDGKSYPATLKDGGGRAEFANGTLHNT